MADKLRQILRLYRLYGKMDWDLLMRDKRLGFTYAICDMLPPLSTAAGLGLLAIRFNGIGGLTADEILWMLGFFTLADGMTLMMLGGYNVLHISRRVGRGQVDHMLIQPVPLWMQLLTEGFMPFTGSSSFIVGLGMVIAATIRLGLSVTPGWLLTLVLYMLARMAVAAGCSFIAGTAAFYKPVACEELSSVVLDALTTAGQYPLVSLPDWLIGIFSTFLPVSLMAWLPGMILLQKINAPLAMAWPFAAGAGLLALAGLLFRKGLKHYAAHGCPRYKEMGHRC